MTAPSSPLRDEPAAERISRPRLEESAQRPSPNETMVDPPQKDVRFGGQGAQALLDPRPCARAGNAPSERLEGRPHERPPPPGETPGNHDRERGDVLLGQESRHSKERGRPMNFEQGLGVASEAHRLAST